MSLYTIRQGTAEERQSVAALLHGLDAIAPSMRDSVLTAWVSSWKSSAYEDLRQVPHSPISPGYSLVDHVNDVTRNGIDLAERARRDWGYRIDDDELIPILLLHDIDKPLIYARTDDGVISTPAGKAVPHGVLGAMLLKELGFADIVVTTVATHANDAPFRGETILGQVLHHADAFASDHAFMRSGVRPGFTRRTM